MTAELINVVSYRYFIYQMHEQRQHCNVRPFDLIGPAFFIVGRPKLLVLFNLWGKVELGVSVVCDGVFNDDRYVRRHGNDHSGR